MANVTLSQSQIQRLLRSVGRPDDSDIQADIPSFIQERQESNPLSCVSTRLLYLYVRVDVIDGLMGGTWELVTWKEGDEQDNDSDKLKALIAMKKSVMEEIEELEEEISTGITGGGQTALVGQLATTHTVMHPCHPNPNDRRYAGDPLRGRTWRP